MNTRFPRRAWQAGLFTAVALLALQHATAQGSAPAEAWDPLAHLGLLGASVLIFGNAVMRVVEFLKTLIRDRWPDVPGGVFVLLSFLVSGALTLIINAAGMLTDPALSSLPAGWAPVAFWLVGAAVASGWYDGERKLRQESRS